MKFKSMNKYNYRKIKNYLIKKEKFKERKMRKYTKFLRKYTKFLYLTKYFKNIKIILKI